MSGLRSKIDYILKHNKFVFFIYYHLMSLFFRFVGIFIPIKNNRVLFSGHSRKYNDSPRAIYEFLIADERYSELEIIWALDDINENIPGNCLKVKADTWKYFIYALSAKYWVTCVNIERGLKFKKKKTIYLNTWHGTPIKSIGGIEGRKDDDFSHIDYFCTCGSYESEQFFKAFNVKQESLLRTGLPRNDILYSISNETVIEIKRRLGLPSDKKIILYAPTWRDSQDGVDYNLRPPIDFNKWKKQLGSDYIVLLRLHPYTTKLLDIEFDDFVLDYSSYRNINDLLIISDILISDYSATIFDFSILERPILCFGYDFHAYKKSRGFAMDLEKEIPGGLIDNEDKLIEMIKENKQELIFQVKEFKKKYLEYGGNATKICVNVLFNNFFNDSKEVTL